MATAQRPVYHNSILQAGKEWLKDFCFQFPNGSKSTIHPIIFDSKYKAARDKNNNIPQNPCLKAKDKGKVIGLSVNQYGEMAEHQTYRLFYELTTREYSANTYLILRSFALDCDNGEDIRRNTLEKELGSINLTGIPTNGESDFVMMVKDIGIILIEVKTKTIGNAEAQLDRGCAFFHELLKAISPKSAYFHPIARIVVLPFNKDPTPNSRTPQGTFLIHKDILDDFEEFAGKIDAIITQMQDPQITPFLQPSNFETFCAYVVGLWSMMPLHVDDLGRYSFDKHCYDMRLQLNKVDTDVDHADFDSKTGDSKPRKPLWNIKRASSPFLNKNAIKIIFITPPQKHLFHAYRQVIIRGPAGVGKSLLLYFKVLQVFNKETNQNILIVAPSPTIIGSSMFFCRIMFQAKY